MLDFDDPNELNGTVLDQRWRLVRPLGQGGLAVVFEGQSVDGGEPVAIKLLRAEFGENSEIVERFLGELKASARVDHPAIARVHEAVRAADGSPYLVLELLPGEPLSARMNRGRLSVEQASGIALGILDGLAAAHAAGVLHRDLKPGNVFLTGGGDGTDVKILDFGIARVIDAAGGAHRHTRTGMLLGTPGYMSPEQIQSVKSTDPRSDLWSVGIILFEMLTGVRAYEAENDFMRVTKVLNQDPTPIEQVAPQYAHWGPFFRRALARDPGERFASAESMARALAATARGEALAPAIESGVAYGSLPPAPAPPAFGSSDTAISPGSAFPPGMPSEAPPNVQVVAAGGPGVRIPLALALLLAGIAMMLGFGAGLLVGSL